MAEPAPNAGMTAEEFFERYCGQPFELVNGEVVEISPTGGVHGKRAGRLTGLLDAFVSERNLGHVGNEIGFVLAREPDVMRAPDVAFVRLERFPDELPDGFIEGAPDVAVEVVSPGDRAGEIESKVTEYLEAGTSEVWIIYPNRKHIIVRRDKVAKILRIGDDLCGSGLLEGFRVPLARLFAR